MRTSTGIAVYRRIGDGRTCLAPVEPLILDEVREMLSSIRVEIGLAGAPSARITSCVASSMWKYSMSLMPSGMAGVIEVPLTRGALG